MPEKLTLEREISLEELTRLIRTQKEAKVRERLLILLHIKKGRTTREVGELLQINKGKVSYWVHRFNEEGIQGLSTRPKSGHPAKVDYRDLRQTLSQSPRAFGYPHVVWFPKLVWQYLKEYQQVDVAPEHIYWVIKRAGYTLKVPRPRHYRSSPQKVVEFKKNESSRGKSCAPTSSGS